MDGPLQAAGHAPGVDDHLGGREPRDARLFQIWRVPARTISSPSPGSLGVDLPAAAHGTSSFPSGSASTPSPPCPTRSTSICRRAKPAKHFPRLRAVRHLLPAPGRGADHAADRAGAAVRRAAAGDRRTSSIFGLAPDHPRPVPEGGARRRLPRAGGREGLRRARRRPDDARRAGSRRWPSAGRSSATSPAIRPPRSGSLCASASPCPTISASPMRRSASPISGDDGTSRCRAGCATISTSRSAATATGRREPMPR